MKHKLLTIAIALGIGSIANTQTNQQLSNLIAPTAVNVDLLPSVTNTRDIGSDSLKWRNLYLSGFLSLDNAVFINNNGGADNCYIGKRAGRYVTTGYQNIGVGTQALFNTTTGYQNIAVGYQSMFNTVQPSGCIALGYQALYNDSIGGVNVAVGSYSLFNNKNGTGNIGIGYNTLYETGRTTTPGSDQSSHNVAIGSGAATKNTTGYYNVAIGSFSMSQNTTGWHNVAIGHAALQPLTTGQDNVAVGYDAGYTNNNIKVTSLGAYARAADGLNYTTALGADAIATASNMVRVGATSVISIGGQVGWTTFSDGRYKNNITEAVPGLQFINRLRPVVYNVDVAALNNALQAISPLPRQATEEDKRAAEAQSRITYSGFVAQEVEAAAKQTGYTFSGVDAPKNSKDFYGLRYAEFVVPLVKAVQELSIKTDEVEALKKQVTNQQQQIDELKTMVNKLLNDKAVTMK